MNKSAKMYTSYPRKRPSAPEKESRSSTELQADIANRVKHTQTSIEVMKKHLELETQN